MWSVLFVPLHDCGVEKGSNNSGPEVKVVKVVMVVMVVVAVKVNGCSLCGDGRSSPGSRFSSDMSMMDVRS